MLWGDTDCGHLDGCTRMRRRGSSRLPPPCATPGRRLLCVVEATPATTSTSCAATTTSYTVGETMSGDTGVRPWVERARTMGMSRYFLWF